MKPHQIKCAVVSTMYRDGIFTDSKPANIESVAKFAVDRAFRSEAEYEITEYMIPDDECPVEKLAPGVIGLQRDDDKIRAYLERYCEEMPPGFGEL